MNEMANFSQMSFVSFYHKTGHFCSKVARFMIIYREGKISILRSNWVYDIVLLVKNKSLWLKKKLIYAPSGFNFAVQKLFTTLCQIVIHGKQVWKSLMMLENPFNEADDISSNTILQLLTMDFCWRFSEIFCKKLTKSLQLTNSCSK